MKQTYKRVSLEIIRFDTEDIIDNSNQTEILIDDGSDDEP